MFEPKIIGTACLTSTPAETRATMIDVEVEEDWTNTVTRMPIMTPTTGLERSSEFEKKEERLRPPRMRKDVLRKVKETMKRYRETRMPTVFRVADKTLFTKGGCWIFILKVKPFSSLFQSFL
jgi:hypothetical protein